jgi:hypothetical protein
MEKKTTSSLSLSDDRSIRRVVRECNSIERFLQKLQMFFLVSREDFAKIKEFPLEEIQQWNSMM